MKDGHVKDAANATFQGAKKGMLRQAPTRTRTPPIRLPLGDMKDEHVKDEAQGVAEDVPQGVVQELAFRARAARALIATLPPPPPPSWCSSS